MSKLFIDRPIFAWVIAIIIMLMGIGAITQLPVAQYPDVAPTQINVRASEEALRVNQQRYALGAGTLLDVLTSQSNLIVARQQLIQTRLDYRNARAQIEALIGRDLP